MAIDILRENVSIHQTLGDEPNTDNGLSADDLKARFDRGAEIIRDYINETVVHAVNDAANKSETAEAAAAESKSIAESANQKAADALQKAGTAEGAAASAAQIASNASSYANSANDKAQQAMVAASDAKQVADTALASAEGSTNRAYEALRIANDVAQEMKDYSPSGTRSIAEAAMRMAAERIVAPEKAVIGQYFRVKEIDENGKITAVEAVDAPAGGGSGVYVGDEDGAVLAEIFINPDDPPTDYIPAPLAATVGQTMVVEKVNGNGVPTKWRVSDLPTVPNALPNPHPLTIGDQTYDGSTAVNIKLPSGDSGGGRLLGEITLSEDVNGTIIIPLNDNPFLYGKLLIEMNAQLVDNGDGQYMGTIFGGTKQVRCFHLNTLFSADKTSTVWVMVDLFRDIVHTIATRKVDYMWLTNNQYSFAYEIDETQDASDNMLEISWCSAVSGATFKVWGK